MGATNGGPLFKSFNLIALSVLFSWSAFGEVLPLGRGRVVDVQVSPPLSGRPLVLMLPGVNRGLKLDEPAAQALMKRGIGVATFNFSVQPASVAHLDQGTKPWFRDHVVTLHDLADEVHFIARYLSERYRNTEVVPVTLSYSGTLSTQLEFANLVDTVPLTSMAAFSPQLEAYKNWLKAGELLNPIFGPVITRQWLDAAYRMQWQTMVNALSTQPDFPAYRKGDMVEGYLQMSRATENYEWQDEGHSRHDFILAAGESASLLRHQVEVVSARLAKGLPERVFVVAQSGHIIPADQPEAYARVMDVITSKRPNQGAVILVDPNSDKWVEMSAQEGVAFLKKLGVSEKPSKPKENNGEAPKDPIPGSF